jgi:hypothetical protein
MRQQVLGETRWDNGKTGQKTGQTTQRPGSGNNESAVPARHEDAELTSTVIKAMRIDLQTFGS